MQATGWPVANAPPSRAGELPLFIEQRNAEIAQDGGNVALPLEDRGVDPAPPLGLVSTNPHRDVVFHASGARLVLQGYQGKRQIIVLSVVGGDGSPQKAHIDRPVDDILNHLVG